MGKIIILVSLVSCSFFFAHPLAAQSDSVAIDLEIIEDSRIYRPNFALKWDFLALLTFAPAIQLAAEFKTKEHQSFQVESGFVFNYASRALTNTDFKGFKSKLEYRFYHRGRNGNERNSFWGFQYANRFIAAPQVNFIDVDGGNFQKIAEYNVQSFNNFLYLMGGFVAKNFGPQYFEMSMGLGYRNLNIGTSKLPDGLTVTQVPGEFWFGNSTVGNYSYPAIFLSAKWIFWTRKKK